MKQAFETSVATVDDQHHAAAAAIERLSDPLGQRLGDRVAHTVVVRR